MRFLFMAALVMGAASSASAQQLGNAVDLVWPGELMARQLDCDQLSKATPGYLKLPRPAFNCLKGADCPEDLAPAPPQSTSYRAFYSFVDLEQRPPYKVSFPDSASEIFRYSIAKVVKDMDRVARSKSRTITVIGHTDSAGVPKQLEALSKQIGQCVANALNVSLHLNGYKGAYDFAISARAGAGELTTPTARGVREPINRNAEITISY